MPPWKGLGVPAMNAQSPCYTYKPLDSAQDEIRIIEITPQHETAIAHERLLSFSMKHQPIAKSQYAALSYVWGDSKITRPILLNGKWFHVTENLWEALNQMSEPGYQSPLWVDAICINQGDDDEKTRQVQMMKHIYSRAKFVIGWLGPAEGRGDFVLAKLTSAGERILRHIGHTTAHSLDNPETWILGEDSEISMSATDDNAALPLHLMDNIFERPYWQRVWIAQELAYAHQACLQCGKTVANWYLFKIACRSLLECRLRPLPSEALGKNSSSLPREILSIRMPRLARIDSKQLILKTISLNFLADCSSKTFLLVSNLSI